MARVCIVFNSLHSDPSSLNNQTADRVMETVCKPHYVILLF